MSVTLRGQWVEKYKEKCSVVGCEELLVSSCFSIHKRTIGKKRKHKN